MKGPISETYQKNGRATAATLVLLFGALFDPDYYPRVYQEEIEDLKSLSHSWSSVASRRLHLDLPLHEHGTCTSKRTHVPNLNQQPS